MMKDIEFQAGRPVKIERHIGIVRLHIYLAEVGQNVFDGKLSILHIEIAFTQKIIEPNLSEVAFSIEILHMLEVELVSPRVNLQYIDTVHIQFGGFAAQIELTHFVQYHVLVRELQVGRTQRLDHPVAKAE